jgi:hydrogenase maturation protease
MQRVTVLVCGEPMRGDDGAAFAVADALPSATRDELDIHRVGSLMPDDLLGLDGPIVILDAVAGPSPGSIVDLPLAAIAADGGSAPSARSSHALPLAATLAIVASLRDDGLPPGRFVGIAVDRVGIGHTLSPAVAAAVPVTARRVATWARLLRHEAEVPACA